MAQIPEDEPPTDATWDEVLGAPKVEPETENVPVSQEDSDAEHVRQQNAEAWPTPLIDMPLTDPFKPDLEPPRVQMATKERKDWFYSLCRSHGLNDAQIATRLGTAGYETIDQVPADVLEGMIKRVSEHKPKAKK